MSLDSSSLHTRGSDSDIQTYDPISHIDSNNRDDDYMLIDENDPLTKAMTVNNLGFDHGEDENNNNNDSNSVSVADDVYSSSYNEQMLAKRKRKDGSNNNNNNNDEKNMSMPPLTKTETIFWSPNMKTERKKIYLHFIKIEFILMIFCFTGLVILWGATYRTQAHYHKVKIIALIQDDDVSIYNNTIVPMTASIPSLISTLPGTWHIFNTSTFQTKYNVSTEDEMNQRMIKLIYDEKYWLALNVKSNVTQYLYNSLTNLNSKPFNSTDFFQKIYESGRDPIHVNAFIVPIMTSLETAFQKYYSKEYIPSFINNITLTNFGNVPKAGHIAFEKIDYRPYYDRILFVATQMACVFALIFTVFQFIVYSKLHGEVTKLVKRSHKIYYRVGLSVLTHFFSSLFWCTIHSVYQVDSTKAFGRAGFVVLWMSTWLYMWAVGGANENVLSIIFAVNPSFLGFWVVGFILMNISATFFPMVLDNSFYRYGYFMPLHNFVDITRVFYMDLSKSHLGRNYGVLVAWIAINTALLPFVMKLVDWLMKRKQQQQK
ncbi:nitrosoguanidine resistance protein Sng1p [Monosporozyma servazzii]